MDVEQKRQEALIHKRRIKRIKTTLIFGLLTMLILPIILCIILFIKIDKIENQIKLISEGKSINVQSSDIDYDSVKEVYAADKETNSMIDDKNIIIKIEDNNDVNNINDNVQSEDNEEDKDINNVNKEDLDSNKKKVYLTFDDGPSINTPQILDVLAEYNVKATFFVIGKEDEYSKEMYRRIVDEGHTIAMHSYSHKYNVIYNSVKDFEKDLKKLKKLLKEVTGVNVKLYRFPGGSSNVVSKVNMTEFIKYLNDNKYVYFDWNVSNGDATDSNLNVDSLVENVIKDVKKYDSSIVLMHDTSSKTNTALALPELLNELNKLNVLILPLDEDVKPIQHIKADSIQQN